MEKLRVANNAEPSALRTQAAAARRPQPLRLTGRGVGKALQRKTGGADGLNQNTDRLDEPVG